MSGIEERIRELIVCGWTRTEATNIIRNEDRKQRMMIREFFASVVDKLSDEECDNIWRYGCSRPDKEMIERKRW